MIKKQLSKCIYNRVHKVHPQQLTTIALNMSIMYSQHIAQKINQSKNKHDERSCESNSVIPSLKFAL